MLLPVIAFEESKASVQVMDPKSFSDNSVLIMRTVLATRLPSAERVPRCSSPYYLVQEYHLHLENMVTRQGFRGPRRKAVLAFDVGTTYSGISYR